MLTLKTSDRLTGAAVAVLTSLATPALADSMSHGTMDWLAPLDTTASAWPWGSGMSPQHHRQPRVPNRGRGDPLWTTPRRLVRQGARGAGDPGRHRGRGLHPLSYLRERLVAPGGHEGEALLRPCFSPPGSPLRWLSSSACSTSLFAAPGPRARTSCGTASTVSRSAWRSWRLNKWGRRRQAG